MKLLVFIIVMFIVFLINFLIFYFIWKIIGKKIYIFIQKNSKKTKKHRNIPKIKDFYVKWFIIKQNLHKKRLKS
jgi:hypothetical protein